MLEVCSLAVLVGVIIAFLYYRFDYSPYQVLKRNGFVGPTPSFFFGNYGQRIKAGGTIKHLEELRKHYGPIVGFYLGRCPNILVCDLELIKLITIKDFDFFMDRPKPPDMVEKKYRPVGLILERGETWKTARRTLSPTFSTFKIKAMTPIVKTSADTLVEVIHKHANADQSFDIVKILSRFTLETIIATSFGRKIDIQRGQYDQLAEAAATAFSSVQEGTTHSMGMLNAIFSNLPWLEVFLSHLLKWSDRTKALRVLFDTLAAILQQRHEEDEPGKYKDLLQMMMDAHVDESDGQTDENRGCETKLTDREIVDHCVMFLLAGYETTAVALSYTTYLLALNAEAQEKLQAEIDAYFKDKPDSTLYQASQDLEYLDMVIHESLRLFPPVALFPRECVKEYTYKGMTFPKGVRIQFCTPVLHKDPQYWEDPETFNPFRFTAEEKAKRPQMCYMPFGSGPRSCIGMRLGLLETKIALIQVLRRFTFVRAPDTEVPLRTILSFTMAPVNGIYLKVVSRKPVGYENGFTT